MLVFLGYFLAFLGFVMLAVALFIWKQGDADFHFDVEKRSKLVLDSATADSMTFSFRLPFRNRGSQQGTMMDVFARPWLPCEQYSAAELTTKVTAASRPRDDGYSDRLRCGSCAYCSGRSRCQPVARWREFGRCARYFDQYLRITRHLESA